jgi:uroporphyrin-III C-methyltransferase
VRWEDYARLNATLCVYMGVKNLPIITRRLEAAGMAPATPVAIIQSATTGDHRRILGTLATISGLAARENVEAPAMLIIGEVVNYSDTLSWFESGRHLEAAAR